MSVASAPRRVIDAFLFYNETAMLKTRLERLCDVVDIFVIIEMDVTFTGKPKASHLMETLRAEPDWFLPYLPKLRAFTVKGVPEEKQPTLNPWVREAMQRHGIAQALGTLPLTPSDVVMMSDVDEIPDPATIRNFIAASSGRPIRPIVCEQLFFYYSFDFMHREPWYGTILATYGEFAVQPPQHWRNLREHLPRLPDGGWHCSYFGDVEHIKNKIRNFSHQEWNKDDILDDANIRRALAEGVDLFGREGIVLVRRERKPDEVIIG